MRAHLFKDVALATLLDPEAAVWRKSRPERLQLSGVPSSLQPTSAVRAEFPDEKIGAVKQASVAVVHNGQEIAFRLEWQDASANNGADGQDDVGFSDAAAILLPAKRGAPLMTMGAPGLPVNAWYWRADEDGQGRHVVAHGLGTTNTVDRELVKGRGIHRNGTWTVVIARPLQVRSKVPVAQLSSGSQTAFSLAIWEGSHGERAGIKAFALGQNEGWHDLTLDRHN